ncbi:MAG: sortase [Candidatus Pacebacteria bacterium]|nr:sortase [Candidatus Paceibacterota bacterium]
MNKKITQTPIDHKALVNLYREAIVSGHDLDKLKNKVEKLAIRSEVSQKIEKKEENKREKKLKDSLPKVVKAGAFMLPITFIAVGLFLISNALIPISDYYYKSITQLSIFDLKTPIPRESVLDITPAVIAQASSNEEKRDLFEEEFGPVIINTQLDYTNLATWFSDASIAELEQKKSDNFFTLEIPKLDVLNANVTVGGTDLDVSLIQYPGTADPGRPGAPVIFGHSVLRQFYNPYEKNPRRYVSIFSKIMTLKTGDEIFLEKDGVKYTYKVSSKSEVKPDDVFILTQNYDSKKLKLVTCVPEGTYLRRGVVTAELVE